MSSIHRVGCVSKKYDYFGIAKSVVTSVSLAAISAVAIKGIEHYAKWEITTFQRNIVGCCFSAFFISSVGLLSKLDWRINTFMTAFLVGCQYEINQFLSHSTKKQTPDSLVRKGVSNLSQKEVIRDLCNAPH